MLTTCIYVFLGWFIGGFVGGAAGLGGTMTALPILSLGMPATQAVLVCCIIGAPGCTQLAWLYRKHVVWSDIRWLWAACIPGCILGALTLKVVPVRYLQIMISIMIACFVLLQCFSSKATWRLRDSVLSLLITGLASGFVNSSISVVGVPIGIFILLKHWDKDRARSTMGMLFLLSGWITLASQWAAGMYTLELFLLAIAGIVASFLGQMLGFRAGKHLNQKLFTRLVLAFLTFSAVILFYKALA